MSIERSQCKEATGVDRSQIEFMCEPNIALQGGLETVSGQNFKGSFGVA